MYEFICEINENYRDQIYKYLREIKEVHVELDKKLSLLSKDMKKLKCSPPLLSIEPIESTTPK